MTSQKPYSAWRFLCLAIALTIFCAGNTIKAAHAQGSSSAEQTQPSISDEQLRNFSVAAHMVTALQEQYEGLATQAASDEELAALTQQTNTQIIQSIQSTGLTIDEFNYIAEALQYDEQLRQRYKSLAK